MYQRREVVITAFRYDATISVIKKLENQNTVKASNSTESIGALSANSCNVRASLKALSNTVDIP
ncbi:hypothetical protein [Neokomagataea tanensis]|uniref:hypothetical protein n=1 Tax=Neokomagataea tanensis TaxID=661191 RepID=UPI0030842EAF